MRCSASTGLLLALALSGCSGESSHESPEPALPYPYVSSVAVAGCDVQNPCDILSEDCQQNWLAAVSCLRGMDAMVVPIRVIDEPTFAEELAADPPEPRPDPDYEAMALTRLGFIEPGALDAIALAETIVHSVAAYYSTEDGAITVVDHGFAGD